MSSANQKLTATLIQFAEQYCIHFKEEIGHLPVIERDEQWPSPCEVELQSDTHSYWRPALVCDTTGASDTDEPLSFKNVESALDVELHQDIKTYFSTIYSSDIDAKCQEGNLSLLFPWNKDDFDRLQENIIGHILMKRKLKQAITVFFAVTDEEDMIISIDNESGEVWVEQVGCNPHKKLSDSIASFITTLSPNVDSRS